MKKNQKGFSVVEILVILVVVGLIGVVGWLVYERKYKTESKNPIPVVRYTQSTDSTNTFSFSYPDTWQLIPYVWVDCCEGPPEQEPDWTKESKPITLLPPGYEYDQSKILSLPTVRIGSQKYYNDFWKSYEDLKVKVKEDFFAKVLFEGLREDGHKALFTRVDYLGPPDAKVESFTDYRYYFNNGDSAIRVDFREKFHHDWPDDDIRPDVDNTKFLSDFEHIANSIKFSN